METSGRNRLVKALREKIYEITGNYYPDERMKILEYKIERLVKKLNVNDASSEEVVRLLTDNGEVLRELIDIITVPETKFFREHEQLKTFFSELLPRERFVILGSAGCSTGQEVYTLAMMMAAQKINGKVIGFDINEHAIRKAEKAVYSHKHVKDIPEEYRVWVDEKPTHIEISPIIKNMTEFKVANLINTGDFIGMMSYFDAVFCRNVLIYFDRNSKSIAFDNIYMMLKDEGYLILSSTEILESVFHDKFEVLKADKFFFYKKKGSSG